MAATAKTAKRRYHTPGVVSGSLARELDSRELERQLETSGQLDFDQQYRKRKETQAELIARQRARAKAAVRPAQKVSPLAVLGFAGVAALLVCLLLCYVQINAISSSIVEMKQQISALEVEQVSLLTRYEQAFDLATVKEAAQAAGMSQPSDSQIYYIDLPGEDQAVSYEEQTESPLRGVLAFFDQKICAIGEYFR